MVQEVVALTPERAIRACRDAGVLMTRERWTARGEEQFAEVGDELAGCLTLLGRSGSG